MANQRPIVAHVTPWYLPHIGGLERHVEAITTGIPSFDFLIATPRIPGVALTERPADNLRILRFGPVKYPGEDPRSRFTPAWDWILRFARLTRIRHALRTNRFDILHVHRPPVIELAYLASKGGGHAFLRRLARRWNGLPSDDSPQIFTDHGLFVQPSSTSPLDLRWFMEWVLAEYDHVICVDQSGYERARAIRDSAASGLAHAAIHHIPQPIDTQLFHPMPPPVSRDLVIGYSGRWERDGMFLLKDLVESGIPRIRFLISGGATARDLEEYGPVFRRPNVDLRPNILDSRELARFYGDIHILVDFYRGDGCGRSVLEAMASGRTVIRTRSRDTHPVIDGVTGLLVEPTLDSVARTIRSLAESRERLDEIGSRAREAIEREHSYRLVLGQIETLYRECLSERHHERRPRASHSQD